MVVPEQFKMLSDHLIAKVYSETEVLKLLEYEYKTIISSLRIVHGKHLKVRIIPRH